MGRIAGAEAHQHAVLFIRARGFKGLTNVASVLHALSGNFQNHVALLEPAIRSCALRLYFHDDDAFLACAVDLASWGDRQAQSRHVRAMGCPFSFAFDVSLGFLRIRQLTKAQADDLALPPVQNVEPDNAARRETSDDASQLAGIFDCLTIYGGDDVARFNAGLGCGPILLRISYQRALSLLQT